MNHHDRAITAAASIDAVCIVIFVAIGRHNHDESSAISGTLSTAAPFLIALLLAWVIVRAWRRPAAVRTGLLIWPLVILIGMLLRHFVFDDGTAAAFIVVATVFLGAFLVGWRAIAGLIVRRRTSIRGAANTAS
jgi:hypothetical protein